jgi:hypothetical protein
MFEQGSRLVRFWEDGADVVALDDRAQTYRTRKGTFDWRADPSIEVPPEPRSLVGRRATALPAPGPTSAARRADSPSGRRPFFPRRP